jgi:hypothetical protein
MLTFLKTTNITGTTILRESSWRSTCKNADDRSNEVIYCAPSNCCNNSCNGGVRSRSGIVNWLTLRASTHIRTFFYSRWTTVKGLRIGELLTSKISSWIIWAICSLIAGRVAKGLGLVCPLSGSSPLYPLLWNGAALIHVLSLQCPPGQYAGVSKPQYYYDSRIS